MTRVVTLAAGVVLVGAFATFDDHLPVVHARHTAVLVPRAQLRIYPDHGHISIVSEVVPSAMNDLRELARA